MKDLIHLGYGNEIIIYLSHEFLHYFLIGIDYVSQVVLIGVGVSVSFLFFSGIDNSWKNSQAFYQL